MLSSIKLENLFPCVALARSKNYGRLLGIVLVICAVIAVPFAATAQKITEDYKKAMPEMTFLPQAEFEAKTFLHEDKPLGLDALEHKIRVPKDWKKVETGLSTYTISNKILTELAQFYSPMQDGLYSSLSVSAQDLEYQLSAEQWLLQYLLSYNYTIQGFKVHDKTRAEALFVKIEKDFTYVIRMLAIINGKNVLVTQYSLPVDFWETEKDQQAQIVDSMHIVQKVAAHAEPSLVYQFLDLAEFRYPQSWEIRAPTLRSIDRMSIELFNVKIETEGASVANNVKILNGKIEISLISYFVTDSLEGEIANFKKELQKSGLTLNDQIEFEEDYKVDPAFEFATFEVYKASDSKNTLQNYEMWVTVMAAGDYYYFVTLLTPSRDNDYILWARNTQSYKFIVESMKPQLNTGKLE